MVRKALERLSGLDGLDNPERIKLLSIIDKFRELGVSEDLSLPQLVVVGDQSSGKSSLLEGITGLAFPIASDLCTRFATQIVLRRAPAEDASIKVSILPGPEANADEGVKEKLLNFGRTLENDEFDAETFTTILGEASRCMGLPTPGSGDIENIAKRFSDDVFKIEISGPTHHHLSVVDVPGLFHNPTKYQTKEDGDIIRGLIGKYIADPRTIIMAVMDARNNLANQEVFRMARVADPSGLRTVGIITKCDALQAGDEPGVLRIAQNQAERLNHGWFAVRNRSTKEIEDGVTIEARHVNEKRFFRTSPWNELKRDRVGVDALKSFLGHLLYNHINDEFPSLIKEIEQLIVETCRDRDALGPPRQTLVEQRQYLTKFAGIYQRSVQNALAGNYENHLGLQHPLKLRMLLHNLNEEFARQVATDGHTRPFLQPNGIVDAEFQEVKEASYGLVARVPVRVCYTSDSESEGSVDRAREVPLEPICPLSISEEQGIDEWIRTIYRESRGAELPGTVNPAVLENMFRQQTVNWERIAFEHLAEVEHIVREFNEILLSETIEDDHMRSRITSRLAPKYTDSVQIARRQLQTILDDERTGILQTVNIYFAESLSALRKDRIVSRLIASGMQDRKNMIVDLPALTKTVHLSNEDQATYDIHDILKSYYKVAVKRFIDNVVIQVVERHYLGSDGPVKQFCPEYVGGLSDPVLSSIAAEDFVVSMARADLNAKLERLQKALEIALNRQLDQPEYSSEEKGAASYARV